MEASPLERLATAAGRPFPNLERAREVTREGLESRRTELAKLAHDEDVAIVLMGSWGRAEATSGSDDDFMVLVQGHDREDVRPSIDEVKGVLDRAPGDQGIFGAPVASEQLVEKIGLDGDTNTNLSRRMLLLLESTHATGQTTHDSVRQAVLRRYLDESIKDYRPPRFLLNDVIRYWRTMCVDFAGKEREGSEKWGLRNAKLRTFRKALFAGGLLPVFECARFTAEHMPDFLDEQLKMPPADRIATAFLSHDAGDAGGRALGAYDDFLGALDHPDFRSELKATTRATASESDAFAEASRLGKEFEQGLLALLFEADSDLRKLARDYVVF